MANWSTTCEHCGEEIVADDPSDIEQLNGEPFHDDCISEYRYSWEPDFPKYYDITIKNDPEGYVPHYIEDIYKPWDVVIGTADGEKEISSYDINSSIWRLGHHTLVTFRIDESWNVEPVAVNGKKVVDEEFDRNA